MSLTKIIRVNLVTRTDLLDRLFATGRGNECSYFKGRGALGAFDRIFGFLGRPLRIMNESLNIPGSLGNIGRFAGSRNHPRDGQPRTDLVSLGQAYQRTHPDR